MEINFKEVERLLTTPELSCNEKEYVCEDCTDIYGTLACGDICECECHK